MEIIHLYLLHLSILLVTKALVKGQKRKFVRRDTKQRKVYNGFKKEKLTNNILLESHVENVSIYPVPL